MDDREILMELLRDCGTIEGYGMDLREKVAAYLMANDVVIKKHGRWTKDSKMQGVVYCSACNNCYIYGEWVTDGKWQYCPHCGAKMDLPEPYSPDISRDQWEDHANFMD